MDDDAKLEYCLSVYRANQDEFANHHHGQFVLIHDGNVIDFYANEMEAYTIGKAQYGDDVFLLRPCFRHDEEKTIVFHSRVA